MPSQSFRAAEGERIYAIGDVHGCWDLLAQILSRIQADNQTRAPLKARIVLLGDVIDRGPNSREVMTNLVRYTHSSDRFNVLMGNHEQLMWKALSGDVDALKGWLEVGGAATLASFGVAEALLSPGREKRLLREARRRVGPHLVVWLERRPLMMTSGDLVFVHAGVRPGVLLAAQSSRDLLWIRSPFIESEEERPYLTVHGHTVSHGGPEVRPNRIGLDTEAYVSGQLTAMGFESDRRWLLST